MTGDNNNEYTELLDELEAETGGTVINLALARIMPGTTSDTVQNEMPGILAYTESILLFKHYPQANWLSSLMTTGRSKHIKKPVSLAIPFSSITGIERIAESGFLKKLISNKDPLYVIEYRDTCGTLQKLHIAVSFCKSGEPDFYRQIFGRVTP